MSARAKQPVPGSHTAPETTSIPAAQATGCAPALARLTWMLGGNVALFLLAFSIMKRRAFSVLDGLFWATVAGLILVRYLDVAKLQGKTADGEPASMRHWLRYAVALLAAAAALWGLSHSDAARYLVP